ncbi:MAG: hypothetical protein QNL33_06995 [Akkermansiaceae bacterium]|jgi:hypothetical protein
MKSALFLTLALLCQPLLGEEKKAATDFIRVKRTEKEALLQPAITTYQKDGITVTLIGAIHLADKAYYQDLTTRFQKFDRLLFEMIGGESLAAPKSDQEEAAPTEHPLARVYAMVGTFLKLADQKSQIDYTAKNFVHADLTATEFKKLQEEREESILSFALDASENSDTAKQPSTEALMQALLSGDPNRSKLLLIDALAEGDEAVAGLTGQSVIITDRNAKCLKVLTAEIAKGHKSLGIFYGAAHFPDMEKSLLKLGYKMTQQEWTTAWTVPKT